MNRREFLVFSGFTGFVLMTHLSGGGRLLQIPVEVEYQGKLFRGTRNGKIYSSNDGGKFWTLHSDLGNQCAIEKLYTGSDGVFYSQVGL